VLSPAVLSPAVFSAGLLFFMKEAALVQQFRFEPPFGVAGLFWLCLGLLLAGVLLRVVLGAGAASSRRHPALWILRCVTLGLLVFVLAGPTWVEVIPGKTTRPDLFLLLDASRSMEIGKERSRWEEAATVIQAACDPLPPDLRSSLHSFRFGHRIAAIPPEQGVGTLPPTDSDSRLAEALRQLSGRFGRRPPAGVVLFSDGQVRDPDAVRELAAHYHRQGIPVHVYSPPVTTDQGDVAVVAAVAPPRVRKFSDVEVQVFLRSSGYPDQRTEVSLIVPAEEGRPEEILASVPVSLRGGVQAVPLTYRTDFKGRRFEVRVAKMPEELTDRNNRMPLEVQIERPKIRVLYIDGSEALAKSLQAAAPSPGTTPRAPLQTVLMEDEDIECALLIRGNNRTLVRPPGNSGGTIFRFPTTQAELSAFDCLILSDIPAEYFQPAQLQWIKDWVEKRGGGLVMSGGPDSFSSGGWKTTVLADLLPVLIDDTRWVESGEMSVQLKPVHSQGLHPIWKLVPERQANLQLLDQIPAFSSVTLGLRPKSAAEILAVRSVSGEMSGAAGHRQEPLLVIGRDGLGRTMAMGWQTASAQAFLNQWGAASGKNAAKFWRNVVYWLSENSSIGRRRLIAGLDKQFYRPGETIQLAATAYDESAQPTTAYRLWGMLEPKSFESIGSEMFAPIRWPESIVRTSGEQLPRIVWGEEFEIPRDPQSPRYAFPFQLTDRLTAGLSDQGFRIELTVYEGQSAGSFSHGTQVDSTSLEVQVLDDPFEQQNTSVNHALLKEIATLSNGKELTTSGQLAELIHALPVETGPASEHRTPLWSHWWLLLLLGTGLTAEWLLRRLHGLA
jgi:uncharacterized membrane protein